jgi:uncharacterized protein YndB with AHSA1/START domain
VQKFIDYKFSGKLLRRKIMVHTTIYPPVQDIDQILVITRVFDAPRELVFKAWTDPQQMKLWWGPKGFTCPECSIDLRPGGKYLNCMRSPDGKDYWSCGTYQEVEAPEKIVCTDSFSDYKANIVSPQVYGMSPDWPAEAIITLILTEHAGKTRLLIQHSPIKPSQEREMCRKGWNESLDKLADYLSRIQNQK